MESAILQGSCFLGGSGERRGTRVESYQTDQLKTSAARLWTLDSRLLPPQPSTLDSSSGLRAGEFFAVKDVSFELRRGELSTPGRSEKEISKKCLGATKVPDSGRRRHQCLGLIGHNRAGFNPILTGCSRRWTLVPRLLLSINGSVLGLTKKENDAKIDEIIDFAEIREAIDMPVQNYSSGISVRLGICRRHGARSLL
jgi:ABC-type polysaccharide/polyol phosphate transport system ATPase subunit